MYRRILPAAVAMLLLGATPSVAQVNIEAFRGKAGLSGAARFSMSSDFGNVDVARSDGAGNITLDNDTGALLVVIRGAAGFLGGKRYANSGVLHVRYTWKMTGLIHPEAFVQGVMEGKEWIWESGILKEKVLSAIKKELTGAPSIKLENVKLKAFNSFLSNL